MPYVPPEVKERIKREISVQRLAEARGIQLRHSPATVADGGTNVSPLWTFLSSRARMPRYIDDPSVRA